MTSATGHTIAIRRIHPHDANTWLHLRCALWPDGQEDHAPEIAAYFRGELPDVAEVLIAEDAHGEVIAFAELSVRTDLPGLAGERAGYVEGLYVIPEARGSGITRALLQASRGWARERNCAAFASDRAERIIIDPAFTRLSR
jgi:aminoglycoside 6'-N-acetyltransferase I